MFDLILKNAIIFAITLVFYVTMQNIPGNITGNDFVLPLLITLAPVLFARIPMMGTRDLVTGNMPSFISSLIFIGLTVGYQILAEVAERKKPVKQFFAQEDLELGGMKFSIRIITILMLVVSTEFLLQLQYTRMGMKKD